MDVAAIATTSMWRLGTTCKRMQVVAEFAVLCMTNIAPLLDTQPHGRRTTYTYKSLKFPKEKTYRDRLCFKSYMVSQIGNWIEIGMLVYMEYLQRLRPNSVQIENKEKTPS